MRGTINISHVNLATTLQCGQAFRWQAGADGWFTGVVGRAVWRLRQADRTLEWQIESHASSWPRLQCQAVGRELDPPMSVQLVRTYLALDRSLPKIVATFPPDESLRRAVAEHWGLRVLRQEPWECLASYIASSTKQIVQIRQIVGALAGRFGEPITDGHHAFPSAERIARASSRQLWDCKLGFRAKYLAAAARQVADGQLDLAGLSRMEYGHALEELLKLPGVGEKIANCVLLFSCGHDEAFPIDVWVERALCRLYFPRREVTKKKLREFVRGHFGPHAGWAQQYLFFSERQRGRSPQ